MSVAPRTDAAPRMRPTEVAAAAREAAEHAAEAKRHALDATNQTSLQAMALQRVEGILNTLGRKVDDLIETVGKERIDEVGETVGTGLYGRVVRMERRVRATDIWRDRLRVSVITAGPLLAAFGGILWWLTQSQWSGLLLHGAKP